jgi:tetratricopeptide (TPR) repeat protein
MASHAQLDAAGGSATRALILLLFLFLVPGYASSQATAPASSSRQKIKALYDAGQWRDVVRMVPESSAQPADLELYRGLALAQLGQYALAERTFRAGYAGHPKDARFLTELAGLAYRDKRFPSAKLDLRHALALDPKDDYSNNFLASIYFLEGNLNAALKYWNRVGKPKLSDLEYDPIPKLDPLILDQAFRFSPGMVWTRNQFLTTGAELASLDLFPHTFYELQAQPDGAFNLVWHNSQRSSWQDLKWTNVVPMLRGLPYLSVYPEFYNLNGKGLNWQSFVRWDDQKRWFSSELAAPLATNPKEHLRLYFEDRNENWNVTDRISSLSDSPAGFNLRKTVIDIGVHSISSSRWQSDVDVEYSYRNFRTLAGIPQAAAPFFTDTSAIALRASAEHPLIRFPERRFSLDATATGEAGKSFSGPLGKYLRMEGSLAADWLPQARGEDYEMTVRLRAGGTVGQVPFDKLFMLGFDRDNDLWLRGHNDLRNGQKGNAPMGRDFVLADAGIEKVLFNNGLFLVKAGPFIDTGDIYDSSQFFGSPKWLTDTGLQTKVKILGRFEFVLGYGKDLRSGNNTFYSSVSR